MSKDDSQPGGLFSKVVRFMHHPAAPAKEVDAQPGDPTGLADLADTQALRKMLQRKRRNDVVRQREFAQLRQLHPAASPTGDATPHLPPDFPVVTWPPGAAVNEPLPQQWWRLKQPADASTLPMDLVSTFPQPQSVHVAGAPTMSGSSPGAHSPVWGGLSSGSVPVWHRHAPTRPIASALAYDPDFEEAAIAFANGDAVGAEALLLQLLAQRAGQADLLEPVWRTLFDLYRAAGLVDRFHAQAGHFAAYFGGPAPPWFSLPAQLGWGSQDLPAAQGHCVVVPVWMGLAGCIDTDATPWLAALEAQVSPGLPLVVDCSRLIRLDFAAAGSLLNWSVRMQARGVALRFEQLHQLAAVFLCMIGLNEHARLEPRRD